MHPFDHALALRALPSDGSTHAFTGEVTGDWLQGRGAFGGLTAALLLRAIERVVDDKRRPVRTLHVHFTAPVQPAEFRIDVTRVRDGGLVSHLSAAMTQDGKNVGMALCTSAAARDEVLRYGEHAVAHAAPSDEVDIVELGPPIAPIFTQHFEYRFALGEAPFSGAERSHLGGYIRARPPRVLDAALAVAFLDAWPPAALARVDHLRAAASVDFRIEFLPEFTTTTVDADTPALVECRSRAAGNGYADEEASLSVGGVLLARCHQLVAILGAMS
jgi:acyl-CoA thioesterase